MPASIIGAARRANPPIMGISYKVFSFLNPTSCLQGAMSLTPGILCILDAIARGAGCQNG